MDNKNLCTPGFASGHTIMFGVSAIVASLVLLAASFFVLRYYVLVVDWAPDGSLIIVPSPPKAPQDTQKPPDTTAPQDTQKPPDTTAPTPTPTPGTDNTILIIVIVLSVAVVILLLMASYWKRFQMDRKVREFEEYSRRLQRTVEQINKQNVEVIKYIRDKMDMTPKEFTELAKEEIEKAKRNRDYMNSYWKTNDENDARQLALGEKKLREVPVATHVNR